MRRIGKAAVAAAILSSLLTSGARAGGVKIDLAPTGAESGASGRLSARIRGSHSRVDVSAQRLAAGGGYDLVVGGQAVASLRAKRGGTLRARFENRPSARSLPLDFDPTCATVEIRQGGAPVLVGEHACDPGPAACCVEAGGSPSCEMRTPGECLQLGGAPGSAPSCDPDPCVAVPPTPTPEPPPPVSYALCCTLNRAADGYDCSARAGETVAAEQVCVSSGGTPHGSGLCSASTCADVPVPEFTCQEHCWHEFWICVAECNFEYCANVCQHYGLSQCIGKCQAQP